jgi:retinol dehydrogenase-14
MSISPASPMRGKTVLVTGASSGIGLETARSLASAGADLILLCRDRRRGAAARDEIARAASGENAPDLVVGDLFSQADIRAVAADVSDRYDHLDVLINNAGGVFSKRELTPDGIEKTFALNHLAPFLLTNLLLDRLQSAPHGRVVTVSSEIHAGKLDWDNLQSEKRHQFLKAYKVAKTENILFTYELARRLQRTSVTATAVSPGPSRTGFGDNLTGAAAVFPKVMKKMPFFHSAEKGSRVVVYAAAEPTLADVTGEFFMNNKPRKSKPITHSLEAAAQLWTLSEELTGLATGSASRNTRVSP